MVPCFSPAMSREVANSFQKSKKTSRKTYQRANTFSCFTDNESQVSTASTASVNTDVSRQSRTVKQAVRASEVKPTYHRANTFSCFSDSEQSQRTGSVDTDAKKQDASRLRALDLAHEFEQDTTRDFTLNKNGIKVIPKKSKYTQSPSLVMPCPKQAAQKFNSTRANRASQVKYHRSNTFSGFSNGEDPAATQQSRTVKQAVKASQVKPQFHRANTFSCFGENEDSQIPAARKLTESRFRVFEPLHE